MQPIPARLSHAIRTAFRVAKPATQSSFSRPTQNSRCRPAFWGADRRWSLIETPGTRFYSSDRSNSTTLNEKVENAKDRIHTSLSSRAQAVADTDSSVKSSRHETIIHARPESSSLVSPKTSASRTPGDWKERSQAASSDYEPPLPSQIADLRSRLASRFSRVMDNFQTNVFIASQRLNDLTGYTGIERLKRDIDEQELQVQTARQYVKTSRAKYAEAISMRSTTQREVNDLLHRKHTWGQQDLERFTNLYRSDHANEQTEQKAHQELSEAEVKYEEASTRLAKCILARYHEEQIWSDKIRQMSTWGTWGLMGLNILLFVVLQLAIEPWRRRRLVRGFEEKVEVALAARKKENQELRAQLKNQSGDEVVTDAVANKPEPVIATASERVAEAIVDAITGSSDDSRRAKLDTVPVRTEAIGSAVEEVTTRELDQESENANNATEVAKLIGTNGNPDIINADSTTGTGLPSNSTWARLPIALYTTTSHAFISEYNKIRHQFDTTDHIVLSRRQLTIKILEGLATGMALAGGVMYILVRNR